jgi:hypothetical protein
MSLDVYLIISETILRDGSGIFIRHAGETAEISRERWNEMCPWYEPTIMDWVTGERVVYSANITHNLGVMAKSAGIYIHLWRPEELGITKAHELIGPLRDGYRWLRHFPETARQYNPDNGWGTYEELAAFVRKYLTACEEHPEAAVKVSR